MMNFLHSGGLLVDLVDIVLVAFILYRVMLLLKGILPARFFLALAFVLLISSLSRLAGLRALNSLSENFIGSLLIILVVVFQHDLRRALITSRRAKIGIEPEREATHEVIDELVSAAVALADKKIGALVVLEREIPVSHFIAVGTEIDAKVTSELITSIFLPYSPIHDGAVIIQKGKLTKAGCFLPLTPNPAVAKELGTRHRAAIGLTEVVDAVVVVVSEETGRISVAVDGRLNSGIDEAGLKKALRKLIEPRWLS